MSLNRYEPYQLASWPSLDRWSHLREDLNSLFELPFWGTFGRPTQLFSGWSPALDLYQTNDTFVATIELPGMRKEDIEISFRDGTLTIAGERKSRSANGEKTERTERYVGQFRRSITLPARVDAEKVSATYRDGILAVTLPKVEEAKPKQIQVSAD